MEVYGINSAGCTEQPDNDVYCPAIGNGTDNKRFNAHSSSCEVRLAARNIDKVCRVCKGIVPEVVQKVDIVNDYSEVEEFAVENCRCGNKRRKRRKYCDTCRVVENLAGRNRKRIEKRKRSVSAKGNVKEWRGD